MNIGQLARNQRMLYNFYSRNSDYAAQMQTQFSRSDALSDAQSRNEIDADSLLQKMGMSGLEGRTVREMAKYRLEQVQKETQVQQESDTGLGIDGLVQQFVTRALYTPISEEATEAMQDLALQDAVNSVGNTSLPNVEERAALIQEHLEGVASSKRPAVFNAMNKVWESELDRIAEFIREKDPSWNYWGDSFDTDLLKDYEPGVNVWV